MTDHPDPRAPIHVPQSTRPNPRAPIHAPRSTRPDPRAPIRDALARDALAGLDAARVARTTLATALEAAVQCRVKDASNVATRRAAHRPARPSRIEADPDLRAYIEGINRLTFEDAIAEVRTNFPPKRQTSRSALHRPQHRTGTFAAPNRHVCRTRNRRIPALNSQPRVRLAVIKPFDL